MVLTAKNLFSRGRGRPAKNPTTLLRQDLEDKVKLYEFYNGTDVEEIEEKIQALRKVKNLEPVIREIGTNIGEDPAVTEEKVKLQSKRKYVKKSVDSDEHSDDAESPEKQTPIPTKTEKKATQTSNEIKDETADKKRAHSEDSNGTGMSRFLLQF